MEKEKAIEIFNKWMDCKDAYQADPSCDGNCFSCEYYASAEEEKEAMLLAISALEKQEQDRWHSVAKEGNPKESGAYNCTCSDGTPVRRVTTIKYNKGINEWAMTGRRTFWKVLARSPLPKPYTEEES